MVNKSPDRKVRDEDACQVVPVSQSGAADCLDRLLVLTNETFDIPLAMFLKVVKHETGRRELYWFTVVGPIV